MASGKPGERFWAGSHGKEAWEINAQIRINEYGVPGFKTRRYKKLDFRSVFGTIFGVEVKAMNITDDIKPVTYLKSRAADLLNQINETHRPVIITQNGEPRAVLQDPKSYENMRNAIGLLKLLSQGEVDIRSGQTKSQENVFNEIEGTLKKRLK